MDEEVRFWFYSGLSALRRGKAKAAGIPGAECMTRPAVDREELDFPAGVEPSNPDWDVVVFAPPETETEFGCIAADAESEPDGDPPDTEPEPEGAPIDPETDPETGPHDPEPEPKE